MASSNTQGFWHELINGWSLKARMATVIVAGLIAIFISAIVIVLLVLLIFERHENVELGPFKVTQPETPLEKNCRLVTEKARMQDQDISNEILALEAQVAAKDRELSETRSKCLDAEAKTHRAAAADVVDGIPSHHFQQPLPQSRCRTEISSTDAFGSYFAHPQGDYETALTSAAQDRNGIQSKIAAKEHLRVQQQQRLEQVCLGVVAQDATAKGSHTP